MKSKTILITATGVLLSTAVFAQQTSSGTQYIQNAKLYKAPAAGSAVVNEAEEKPKTTKEKVASVQEKFETLVLGTTGVLNKMVEEPGTILSKDVVDAVDQAVRDLESLKRQCDAYGNELNTSWKAIESSDSFTAEEKTELQQAHNTMVESCESMDKKIGLSLAAMKTATTRMKEWRTVYKSYLNLQGEAKATEKLRGLVADFTTSLQGVETPAAAPEGEVGAEAPAS